jgi:hypothetical protein
VGDFAVSGGVFREVRCEFDAWYTCSVCAVRMRPLVYLISILSMFVSCFL